MLSELFHLLGDVLNFDKRMSRWRDMNRGVVGHATSTNPEPPPPGAEPSLIANLFPRANGSHDGVGAMPFAMRLECPDLVACAGRKSLLTKVRINPTPPNPSACR